MKPRSYEQCEGDGQALARLIAETIDACGGETPGVISYALSLNLAGALRTMPPDRVRASLDWIAEMVGVQPPERLHRLHRDVLPPPRRRTRGRQ